MDIYNYHVNGIHYKFMGLWKNFHMKFCPKVWESP